MSFSSGLVNLLSTCPVPGLKHVLIKPQTRDCDRYSGSGVQTYLVAARKGDGLEHTILHRESTSDRGINGTAACSMHASPCELAHSNNKSPGSIYTVPDQMWSPHSISQDNHGTQFPTDRAVAQTRKYHATLSIPKVKETLYSFHKFFAYMPRIRRTIACAIRENRQDSCSFLATLSPVRCKVRQVHAVQ